MSNITIGENKYTVTVDQNNFITVDVGVVGSPGPQGPAGADGADGLGVPAGGTAGQHLVKIDSVDNNTQWTTPTDNDVAAVWGNITGTLSLQTDLQTELDGKSATTHLHTGVYEPVFTKNTAFNKDFGILGTEVCVGNDGRLSDARTPLSHTHTESEITDLQSYLLNINGESLQDLSDVNTLMVPTEDQILAWDNTAGEWIARDRVDNDAAAVWGNITGTLSSQTDLQTVLDGKSATTHNHTFDSLSNVTITTIATGEIPKWSGTAWINNTLAEADISDTSHLHTGVYEPADSAIQTHIGDATKHRLINDAGTLTTELFSASKIISDLSGKSDTGHNHSLDGLSNVTITTNSIGEILKWNGSAWINNTLAEAAIAAASHTHLEADISNLGTTIVLDSDIGVNVQAYNANIQTHIGDATKHRLINDAGTLTTELFSASKIISDLSGKSDTGHVHAINDLSDVTNATPLDKHILIFDGVTDNKYENRLIVESDISNLQSYILAAGVTYEQLDTNGDVGTAAGTLAIGNHTHTGVYLADVIDDTTPQLGGNLDVNGKVINSVTNGDVVITPNGTGKTKITNLEAPINLNTQTGTAYTAVIGDAEEMITMNNAAANTVTIPANVSVAYPIGTKLNFMQLGAGATTVAITTDTLNVNASLTKVLDGQYAVATALKITSTSWVIFGNLVAA